MSYTLNWLPLAEHRLEELDTEARRLVDLFMMDVCEHPHDPPGIAISGYQPTAFTAAIAGADVVLTFVVFHGIEEVRVLWLETLGDLFE